MSKAAAGCGQEWTNFTLQPAGSALFMEQRSTLGVSSLVLSPFTGTGVFRSQLNISLSKPQIPNLGLKEGALRPGIRPLHNPLE